MHNVLPNNFQNNSRDSKWLHRFAVLTACSTFALIFVGGLVTSHDAGLSVPDWPTTYGQFMFSFPYHDWVGNIFYEHSHRIVASIVGFLITVQAVWVQLSENRTWVKWLAWSSLGGVIAQGILGGLTVIFLLPPAISSAHATLAQIVLCLATLLALVTSSKWNADSAAPFRTGGEHLRTLTKVTVGAIFLQLLIGAIMRHTSSGLAIPTFPLAFGKIIPDFTSFGIAINFAHRVGALCVATLVIWTGIVALKIAPQYRRTVIISFGLLLLQISLGAVTILTSKAITPTTLHVSCGAALLVTMFVIAANVHHLFSPKIRTVLENLSLAPSLQELSPSLQEMS